MDRVASSRWRGGRAGVLRRLAIGIAATGGLGAVIANQSAVHWRSNIADDHLFVYYGWCVAQGATPYVDIWDNKPPGIWWLNAAAVRVLGHGARMEMMLGSLALLGCLVAFIGIARTLYHRSLFWPALLVGALLLTHLRFEAGGNRTETYVMTLETLAVLGYVHYLRQRRWGWLLLAGLAAGAAPLFKQSGLAVAAAGALHLAWTQWRARRAGRAQWESRPWIVAGIGFTAPPLLAMISLAAGGALSEAAFATGAFNRAYFEIGDATWLRLDRALRVYGPVLALLKPLLFVVGVGWMAGLWAAWRGRKAAAPPRRGVGLIALWLVFAFYLACVGPGRRGHHLMPILPALGLLALYPLHLLVARRGLWRSMLAHPATAALLVAWIYLVGSLAPSSMREANRSWERKSHWFALHHAAPPPYEIQADVVRRMTTPGDRIYVCGWSPGTYRYSLRLPASRFATLEKVGQLGEHARFIEENALQDVRRMRPRIIVVSTADYAGMLRAPRSDFADWLSAEYEIAETPAGMHVLARRGAGRLDKAAPDR
jgi:hypothetical protein